MPSTTSKTNTHKDIHSLRLRRLGPTTVRGRALSRETVLWFTGSGAVTAHGHRPPTVAMAPVRRRSAPRRRAAYLWISSACRSNSAAKHSPESGSHYFVSRQASKPSGAPSRVKPAASSSATSRSRAGQWLSETTTSSLITTPRCFTR